MLTFKSIFSDNNHYCDKFGKYGNAYIKAIGWIFEDIDDTEYSSGYSFQGLQTPDVMSLVTHFISTATKTNSEFSLNDYIAAIQLTSLNWNKLKNGEIYTEVNDKSEKIVVVKYLNPMLVDSVLWCAFIYYETILPENNKARDILYSLLLKRSGFAEETFLKEDFLMKKTKSTILRFLKEVELIENEEKKEKECKKTEEVETAKKLKKYKTHPIYGQFYNEVCQSISCILISDARKKSFKDYVYVFESAERCVKKIMADSDLIEEQLELEITKLIANFDNYSKGENKNGYNNNIYLLIALIVILVLHDSINDESSIIQRHLTDWSEAITNRCQNWYSATHHPLWKVVAERIKPANRRTEADLAQEINTLQNKLSECRIEISKKDKTIHELESGYEKEENEIKVYNTPKKIAILRYLLKLPTPLTGPERTEFKKLCMLFTKANDSTLERLLSTGELLRNEEITDSILSSYPILNNRK